MAKIQHASEEMCFVLVYVILLIGIVPANIQDIKANGLRKSLQEKLILILPDKYLDLFVYYLHSKWREIFVESRRPYWITSSVSHK